MNIERRKFLKGIAVSAAASIFIPRKVFAENFYQNNQSEGDSVIDFINTVKTLGGVKVFGRRLSDVWIDSISSFAVYQNAVFSRNNKGEVGLINILDYFHQEGLDSQLKSGKFGFSIPQIDQDLILIGPQNDSIQNSIYFPRPMADYVILCQRKGLAVGKLTSFDNENSDYCIYRFQNMAFKYWKTNRNVEALPVGEVAVSIGLVPSKALKITPNFDLEPELKTATEQGRFRPSTRGVREVECAESQISWEGQASYYSHAGCMGCGIDQRMANGEIFNENAMTMAFMRTGLNKKALVVNKETGKSVVVKITDRGHFENWGRIADLSKGVAEALGFNLGRGLFPVKIILLEC